MNLISILGNAIGLAMDAFSVCVAAGAAISAYDHWVTLAILAVLGGKMLWESFKKNGDGDAASKDPSRGMTLAILAVATSIDAAAVGFSFSALGAGIFMPAIGIGVKIFVEHLVAGRIAARDQIDSISRKDIDSRTPVKAPAIVATTGPHGTVFDFRPVDCISGGMVL